MPVLYNLYIMGLHKIIQFRKEKLRMDIGNLITQDNANEGVWFQVVLYGHKQPFDAKIIGADSDIVQMHQRELIRKLKGSVKGTGKTIDDIDEETLEEFIDNADENVIIRLAGLRTHGKDEPLTIDGRELKNDHDSYAYIIEKIPDFKEFVLKKSNERLNFLSTGKKN